MEGFSNQPRRLGAGGWIILNLPLASSGNRRATGRPPSVASASTCFPDADPATRFYTFELKLTCRTKSSRSVTCTLASGSLSTQTISGTIAATASCSHKRITGLGRHRPGFLSSRQDISCPKCRDFCLCRGANRFHLVWLVFSEFQHI